MHIESHQELYILARLEHIVRYTIHLHPFSECEGRKLAFVGSSPWDRNSANIFTTLFHFIPTATILGRNNRPCFIDLFTHSLRSGSLLCAGAIMVKTRWLGVLPAGSTWAKWDSQVLGSSPSATRNYSWAISTEPSAWFQSICISYNVKLEALSLLGVFWCFWIEKLVVVWFSLWVNISTLSGLTMQKNHIQLSL